MCCFREAKNYERFGAITQSIVLMAIKQLRDLKEDLSLKLKADKSCETPEKKQGKLVLIISDNSVTFSVNEY